MAIDKIHRMDLALPKIERSAGLKDKIFAWPQAKSATIARSFMMGCISDHPGNHLHETTASIHLFLKEVANNDYVA